MFALTWARYLEGRVARPQIVAQAHGAVEQTADGDVGPFRAPRRLCHACAYCWYGGPLAIIPCSPVALRNHSRLSV